MPAPRSILVTFFFTVLCLSSASAQVNVVIDPNLNREEANFAVSAVRAAEQTYRRTFGFTFHPSTRAFVSADPRFLARNYVQTKGGTYSNKLRGFTEWITGEAGFRLIFVNTSQRKYNIRADTTVAKNRQRMWNHEFFHVMQAELFGRGVRNCCGPTQIPPYGPIWLHEGSAAFFARYFEGSRNLVKYLTFARRSTNNLKGRELSFLERWGGMNEVNNSYDISAYAVSRLVDSHGLASIPNFYARVGRRSDWKVAFRETFGQSPEEFYASFP